MSRNSEKKSSHLWGEPDDDHKPRHKRKLENPDIFFTLKVLFASFRQKESLIEVYSRFQPAVRSECSGYRALLCFDA